MPYFVLNRRAGVKGLARLGFDGANLLSRVTMIDVTSKGTEPWVQFSPFFPHGNIPVPFSLGSTSMSVEGIWQALKVFEYEDVDPSRLRITNMVGIKRSVRTHGRILGHRMGLHGESLLSYREARLQIYLPVYRWALEHKLAHLVDGLRELGSSGVVVFLDYETNSDVNNLSKPLSHAGLVKAYLDNVWPSTA